ncbi:hypothetical protein VP01_2569g1 [Puccinia sorghi]|uniref:Uncharacterized protein n=1 Tax=Puccinia sorghi TaxID=27349 RepID=A0A0L6V564_9BASI|nr:hypothetical protein VP01_2569g1 [Puccinia sorghi]
MVLGSPDQQHPSSNSHPSTMRRADSTRSNASSRSLRATSDSKQQEDLINALEAEEERLVNTLTRKLEKLRAEKAELENVLEAESESLVLRLQRQLSLLMQQQQQQQPSSQTGSIPAAPNSSTAPNSPSATIAPNLNALINNPHPLNPSPATLIEVLKTENSNLRNRLVDTEREFIKTARQNEVNSFPTRKKYMQSTKKKLILMHIMYRSELIALRQRAGMSIDDLIGTAPAGEESYPSARAARRRSRGTSTSANGIPIPGLTGSDNPRRSHHAPSFSSSSAQLSFASSTPMTPNSMTGDSANMISASLGTSLTTPSTSYPGLPVPHSTPAASPANDRQSDHPPVHAGSFNDPTPEQIPVGSLSAITSQTPCSTDSAHPDNLSIPTTTTSSSSSRSPSEHLNNSSSNSTDVARGPEIGISSRSGNRVTPPVSLSPLRPSGGAPGGPENRQQFNIHH